MNPATRVTREDNNSRQWQTDREWTSALLQQQMCRPYQARVHGHPDNVYFSFYSQKRDEQQGQKQEQGSSIGVEGSSMREAIDTRLFNSREWSRSQLTEVGGGRRLNVLVPFVNRSED